MKLLLLNASIALTAMVASAQSFAAEYACDGISPRFGYQDFSISCSNDVAPVLFSVGLEIEGEVVTNAFLRVNARDPQSDSLDLAPEEVSQISFFTDHSGRRFLKTLPASTSVVEWIMWHSSHPSAPCVPSAPLVSVVPLAPVFVFDLTQVRRGLGISVTQLVRIKGVQAEGDEYVAGVKLDQDPF